MGSSRRREKGWKDFIANWGGPLRGYLRMAHLAPDSVTDMCWDIWAEAVDAQVDLPRSPDPWPILRALAAPVAAEYVQRDRYERPLVNETAVPAASREESGLVPSADEAHTPMHAWLTAALATLSPTQRTVIVLRYLEGRSDSFIAKRLKIPRSTLRVYAMRALAHLRQYARNTPPPRMISPLNDETCGIPFRTLIDNPGMTRAHTVCKPQRCNGLLPLGHGRSPCNPCRGVTGGGCFVI